MADAFAFEKNHVKESRFDPASNGGRALKGSVYNNGCTLLEDVTVDLVEGNGTWGGTFEVKHPQQYIDWRASYTLKLEDGRSGTIFIVDFDESPESSDPWVSFRGSGALR
jgi:hypothetical protein